jgi:large subunit ribosomal protein L29
MRVKELRELSDEELERKLVDTRQELFNLRFQSATGALENTAQIALVKRDIARIITIRGERQAALERQ